MYVEPQRLPGGIPRPLVITEGSASVIPHQKHTSGQLSDCTPTNTVCTPIAWPGHRTTAWHEQVENAPDIRTWHGGLVDGMRDATGQMYMRNRYYDPATGQFTQTDPIGLAGGLNAYGFAAGDPVTYSDPYGLCPWWKPWCKQLGGGGGFGGGGAGGSWDTSQPTRSSASPQAQAAALIVAAEVLEQRATGTASARQTELTFNLGDLSPDEILQIQSLTEHVGRPIWVVGSAARGERNPTSDIDYLTGPSSLPYWQPVQNELPGIDPEHGIVPGTHNPHQGGAIRFEPGEVPKVIPAQ